MSCCGKVKCIRLVIFHVNSFWFKHQVLGCKFTCLLKWNVVVTVGCSQDFNSVPVEREDLNYVL